jgi:AcrR family transcriptional regulator
VTTAAVTVADIVRRARVSRAAFYAHFAGKEDCFLAATAEGRELMIAQVVSATRALPADAYDEEVLRVACRAYLAFLAAEPAFARVFYIHMPTAGPRAVDRLDAGTGLFADLNQKWHQRASASPGMAVRTIRGVSRPRRRHGRTGAIHGPRGLDRRPSQA